MDLTIHRPEPKQIQDCSGNIVGDPNDIYKPESLVHWCTVKCRWVTRKSLLGKRLQDLLTIDRQIIKNIWFKPRPVAIVSGMFCQGSDLTTPKFKNSN